MVECLLEVNKLFKPDGQCCIFDLQVEAEILGCDLLWADDGPLTLASHLRGSNIFMDMYDDDEYVHNLLAFCNKVAFKFEKFVGEPFSALFAHIKEKAPFIIWLPIAIIQNQATREIVFSYRSIAKCY